jgi:hypothetical protein
MRSIQERRMIFADIFFEASYTGTYVVRLSRATIAAKAA